MKLYMCFVDFNKENHEDQVEYYNELMNVKKFKYILNNYDSFDVLKKINQKILMYRINDIISIPSKCEGTELGSIKTSYNFGKNSNGFGRMFVNKGLGIQSLSRVIRNTICKDLYYDLDIVNAEPTLLYNICKKYGITATILKNYIFNREEVLKQIENDFNISRDIAKEKIISIVNGQKAGRFYSLKPFEEEIKNIYEILIDSPEYTQIHLTSIANFCRKEKEPNKIGSFLSLLLQNEENKCLNVIINYLTINYYIKNNEVIKMFDGCMITKDPSDAINEILKSVYEKTGHNISLKVKKMDECLKLPDNYAETSDENEMLIDMYKGRIQSFIDKNESIIDIAIKNDGLDQYIADVCYAFFKEFIKYDTKTDCYFYCNINNIWKRDKKGLQLSKLIPKCITNIFMIKAQSFNTVNNDLKKYFENLSNICIKISSKCNTDSFISKIIHRCMPLLATDDFYEGCLDSKGNLFAFSDKVYDFETNNIRNIKPNDYIFTNTGYKYPLYTDDEAEQDIINFFKSIYIDNDMYEYVLNIIILTLNGNRTLQQFNIFTGNGSNGKSLIIYILEVILGDYALKIAPETITKPNDRANSTSDLANAKGKRLVYCNEPENSKDNKIQAGKIKELAGMGGKEKLKARGLYQEAATFVIHFMLFILCNDKPALSNADGGVARRVKVINHPIKFVDDPPQNNPLMKQKDDTLFTKFGTDIYRNTFIMMLLIRWVNITSKIKTLQEPKQVITDSSDYITASNEVLGYICEKFEITQNTDDKYSASTLMMEFKKESNSIITNDTFKARMLEISGISWKHTKLGNNYYGLKKLKEEFIKDE